MELCDWSLLLKHGEDLSGSLFFPSAKYQQDHYRQLGEANRG